MKLKKNNSAVETMRSAQGQYAKNVLRVAAACKDGETVTIGGNVYEIDTTLVPGITAGNIRVDCNTGTAAAVAKATLTLTDVPHADNTVIVAGETYTFKASVTTGEREVKIGATAEASIDNLVAAITAGTGGGSLYGSLTVANVGATAVKGSASTMVASARVPGTAGNALTSAGTMTHGSWDAATFGTTQAGVDPTAGQSSDALIAAINAQANEVVSAFDISANEVLIVHHEIGVNALACTETLAGTNNAWASATMYGGVALADAIPLVRMEARVPLAQEVTLDDMHFVFPFTPTKVLIDVRVTSGGARKAWDGGYTITGRRVTLSNAGSTDWATTDTVTVLASE